jgi:hypothetical protein
MVKLHRRGGAEELILEDVALAAPGAGEIHARRRGGGPGRGEPIGARSLRFARPSIMRPIGDLDIYRRALRTRRCRRRPSRARKRCDVGLVLARFLNGCGAYALRPLCRPPKSLVEHPFDRLPN